VHDERVADSERPTRGGGGTGRLGFRGGGGRRHCAPENRSSNSRVTLTSRSPKLSTTATVTSVPMPDPQHSISPRLFKRRRNFAFANPPTYRLQSSRWPPHHPSPSQFRTYDAPSALRFCAAETARALGQRLMPDLVRGAYEAMHNKELVSILQRHRQLLSVFGGLAPQEAASPPTRGSRTAGGPRAVTSFIAKREVPPQYLGES